MTPRIQKKLRPPRSRESLRVTHPHAAGIDVHADIHWVAVPPGDAPPRAGRCDDGRRLVRRVVGRAHVPPHAWVKDFLTRLRSGFPQPPGIAVSSR